jgi:methionine salvage enolase-phosphatase E1
MPARYKLVQAFIRSVTEDGTYQVLTDPVVVYAKLRNLQSGHFETVTTAGGLTQISSTVGETSFSFAIAEGVSAADIVELAETALQLTANKTVAQMRALLVRRKSSTPDFSRACIT